ncbi:MAG TPA: hypothetical protein VKH46_02440 [Thermoanaerobaculia bacterium]|jgi:uncharacterized membrane protein|nr:hypothetical protein [Thermoanaerobaculia bacterium]
MADEPLPPGPPAEPPAPAPPDRTLMLILAYLGPLSLVPILAEKEDAEVQWQAKNGLVLFGAFAVACMIAVFLSALFAIFGCLYWIATTFLMLFYAALIVVGIAKALRGERLVIPVLTDLARRF